MTPLEIEILLHYYTQANDYREGDFSAPAVRRAIDEFTNKLWLLEAQSGVAPDYTSYRLMERGRVYVEALKAVPLPIQEWIMPKAE